MVLCVCTIWGRWEEKSVKKKNGIMSTMTVIVCGAIMGHLLRYICIFIFVILINWSRQPIVMWRLYQSNGKLKVLCMARTPCNNDTQSASIEDITWDIFKMTLQEETIGLKPCELATIKCGIESTFTATVQQHSRYTACNHRSWTT